MHRDFSCFAFSFPVPELPTNVVFIVIVIITHCFVVGGVPRILPAADSVLFFGMTMSPSSSLFSSEIAVIAPSSVAHLLTHVPITNLLTFTLHNSGAFWPRIPLPQSLSVRK